ncbi:MAG: PDDEXK nuclease domain-containing protein [Clostridiales bacterium]|jgi:predicted nuclease of restriction endonuclease-like (RecB) superfamily|nr:PDDEXK nuclease domain-containing protein [Clostridiales bacterium]
MAKKKDNLPVTGGVVTEELPVALLGDISRIIDDSKRKIYAQANSGLVYMFWQVGKRINDEVLGNERAEYGKQIVNSLSVQLQATYGSNFERSNLTRMMKFAREFSDPEISATLSHQLSWSHIREILPLDSTEAKLYYAQETVARNLGVRDLRHLIGRKAYERRENANSLLTTVGKVPFNVFKDPYLLDALDLKDNYLEADLEKAILADITSFILEFGKGFTYVERQKRMPVGDNDFHLDLLFYHRKLKRLVVVELKLEEFKPAFKGQMEFYLKWLNKNEREEGENEPIGIILCPKADRSVVELMELDKSGLAVAEFWTTLPPKAIFEQKIADIMHEAQERIARRKALPSPQGQKLIDYFYEPKDDNDDKD